MHIGGKKRARAAGLIVCGCLLALAAGTSSAAVVKVGTLVLHAEASFSPYKLPRHRYAPIELHGEADIHSTTGSQPPALEEAVLEFDRDGRLLTRGLPTCDPAKIEQATVSQARRRCADAIVGTGHINAIVAVGIFSVKVRAPLTLFNGPRAGAAATVLAHVQPLSLLGETYVVSVPIERERGPYRYKATIDVPKLLGGAGALTEVDGTIDRLYRFHGVDRSYTSARCSDGTLAARGRFTFAGNVVIEGSIEKACTSEP